MNDKLMSQTDSDASSSSLTMLSGSSDSSAGITSESITPCSSWTCRENSDASSSALRMVSGSSTDSTSKSSVCSRSDYDDSASSSSFPVPPARTRDPPNPTGLELTWPLYDGKVALEPVDLVLLKKLTKPGPQSLTHTRSAGTLRRVIHKCVPYPLSGWNPISALSPEERQRRAQLRAAASPATSANDSAPVTANAGDDAASDSGAEEDVWGIINDQQVIQHPKYGTGLFGSVEVESLLDKLVAGYHDYIEGIGDTQPLSCGFVDLDDDQVLTPYLCLLSCSVEMALCPFMHSAFYIPTGY